jgi:hypothetical protein
MTIVFNNGYLELSYLSTPYLGGEQGVGTGLQAGMLINEVDSRGAQSEMAIMDGYSLGTQVVQTIHDESDVGVMVDMLSNDEIYAGVQSEQLIKEETSSGIQAEMLVKPDVMIGVQVAQFIKSSVGAGAQVDAYVDAGVLGSIQAAMNIESVDSLGAQASQSIVDEPWPVGVQAAQLVKTFIDMGLQAKQFPLAHYLCGDVYLNRPYLSQSYLAYCMRATQGVQVLQKVIAPKPTGIQSLQRIDEARSQGVQSLMRLYRQDDVGVQARQQIFEFNDLGVQAQQQIEEVLSIGLQVEGKIRASANVGYQAQMVKATKQGAQVTMVIYNVTQLRILTDFASRGTPALAGNNWTSQQALKIGDFSANNLNTDIVEQRCQTVGTPAIWELRCDTGIPQGAFVDTAAILSHNLTRSARVTLQGSNDPVWGSAGFSVVMVTELENMYYIAPTLPTDSFRYWRLLIEDPTNADELAIGVVIFGSSRMMTVRECFQNPVTFGKRHYKDTIETEGFTNVSNDRATRKYLSLNFADLKIDSGNYRMFTEYMKLVKTDLKALIIPRPTRPSTLAIFSKLTQLPEETHNAISDVEHYISFTFSWDEGL